MYAKNHLFTTSTSHAHTCTRTMLVLLTVDLHMYSIRIYIHVYTCTFTRTMLVLLSVDLHMYSIGIHHIHVHVVILLFSFPLYDTCSLISIPFLFSIIVILITNHTSSVIHSGIDFLSHTIFNFFFSTSNHYPLCNFFVFQKTFFI